MKKMLEELKKLDLDYEVPKDFRKKVMAQIKLEDSKNTSARKVIHLKRYVIACASIAAMFIVVVNIGKTSKFSMLEGASADETISIKNIEEKNDRVFMDVALENADDSFEMDELKNVDMVTSESVLNKNIVIAQDKIVQKLKELNVEYEIISGDIYVLSEISQEIKYELESLAGNIELIENDEQIKIIIK